MLKKIILIGLLMSTTVFADSSSIKSNNQKITNTDVRIPKGMYAPSYKELRDLIVLGINHIGYCEHYEYLKNNNPVQKFNNFAPLINEIEIVNAKKYESCLSTRIISISPLYTKWTEENKGLFALAKVVGACQLSNDIDKMDTSVKYVDSFIKENDETYNKVFYRLHLQLAEFNPEVIKNNNLVINKNHREACDSYIGAFKSEDLHIYEVVHKLLRTKNILLTKPE